MMSVVAVLALGVLPLAAATTPNTPATTRTGEGRAAYTVVEGADGRPTVELYAFVMTRAVFSQSESQDRWPALCDQFWTWDPLAGRFRLVGTSSTTMSGKPQCTFKGTVYFRGELAPRVLFRPSVTVYVEGSQGRVRVPIRVVLEGQDEHGVGMPVILGALDTTRLADGPQRLRVVGGWRDLDITGDPSTSRFVAGGDATVAFEVRNSWR